MDARLCLALLVVIPHATGSAQQPASSDSSVIAALEHRVERATMERDAAFLDSVYAPSFRFKHSTGLIEERGPLLAAMRRPAASAILERSVDSLDVEVHGDIALTTGRIHVRRDVANPRWREYTVRYARVFVRSAGRWQLLTHHSTGETTGPLER